MLFCPWDSPSMDTVVACHFLLQGLFPTQVSNPSIPSPSLTGGVIFFLTSATWEWSEVKVAQQCPTVCDPRDYTVHGVLQARILEWVAFSFSRGSAQPRDLTQVSHTVGRFLTRWATWETSATWEALRKSIETNTPGTYITYLNLTFPSKFALVVLLRK